MSEKITTAEAGNEQENPEVETPEDAGKTFSQEDVNAIVQKRVAKYADYDEIKTQLETLKTELVDTNKAIEAARAETRTEVQTTANKRIIEAETRAAAIGLGFLYPDDAHLYLKADELTVDGDVDASKIKEQLEAVATERPALVRSESTAVTASDAGLGVAGTAPKKSNAQRFADALSR